jgi:phage baseplate assembly protein W
VVQDPIMKNDFLGTGWSFPVEPDANGQIKMARYDEGIRQSIGMILSTARGERVMQPDFGCDLHGLVFAVNNAAAAGQVESAVREALTVWEPRIDLLDIHVLPDQSSPNLLLIEINYAVRTTNSRYNLVYPFYLG